MTLSHVGPQLALLIGAALCLVVSLVLPQRRHGALAPAALVVLAVSAAMQLDLLDEDARLTFDQQWALDPATGVAALVICGATALVVAMSPRWFATDQRHGELYALLLLGALAAQMVAAATDLNQLVVAVLFASVTTYVLAAYHRRSPLAVEAGMKTFLLGGLTNIVLLVAAVLAVAAGGTTLLHDLGPELPGADPWLLVPLAGTLVVGLAFEAGAVPAHAWVPDVAEGAPAPAAAFLTVVPKIGALVAMARVLDVVPADASGWRPAVAVAAVLTMTLGNLAALWQDDVRRLLGWSSVSQSGYALVAVTVVGETPQAVPALLTFLAAYAAANVTAFGVVVALRGRTTLDDYRGLGSRHPLLATSLVVALLSLVGIPPLAGFAGKLAVFTAAVDGGYGWLAAVAVVNTVVSLFYYLRVVAPVVRGTRDTAQPLLARWPVVVVAVGAVTVVLVGVGSDLLLSPAAGAAPFLP